MRDAAFYFELGFEHGYGRMPASYPDNPDYAIGHQKGLDFRGRVFDLCPTVVVNKNGTKTVEFRYCL